MVFFLTTWNTHPWYVLHGGFCYKVHHLSKQRSTTCPNYDPSTHGQKQAPSFLQDRLHWSMERSKVPPLVQARLHWNMEGNKTHHFSMLGFIETWREASFTIFANCSLLKHPKPLIFCTWGVLFQGPPTYYPREWFGIKIHHLSTLCHYIYEF